jgi:hypothetical protein
MRGGTNSLDFETEFAKSQPISPRSIGLGDHQAVQLVLQFLNSDLEPLYGI